jgi:predicted nucleic acid-binding protein
MNELFADSFFFLALLNRLDSKHASATDIARQRREPLVTTTWILTEIADAFCRSQTRGIFVGFEEQLRAQPRIAVVPPTQALYDAGIALYRQRLDKDWSLTDCVSFVVMRDRGITEALTGDHHFEQAGFTALMK